MIHAESKEVIFVFFQLLPGTLQEEKDDPRPSTVSDWGVTFEDWSPNI